MFPDTHHAQVLIFLDLNDECDQKSQKAEMKSFLLKTEDMSNTISKNKPKPDPANYTQGSQNALFKVTFDLSHFRTHSQQNTNKPRFTNRWYKKIPQGHSEVGGTAVSHSLTSAQCSLCVCAFTAGPSVME